MVGAEVGEWFVRCDFYCHWVRVKRIGEIDAREYRYCCCGVEEMLRRAEMVGWLSGGAAIVVADKLARNLKGSPV